MKMNHTISAWPFPLLSRRTFSCCSSQNKNFPPYIFVCTRTIMLLNLAKTRCYPTGNRLPSHQYLFHSTNSYILCYAVPPLLCKKKRVSFWLRQKLSSIPCRRCNSKASESLRLLRLLIASCMGRS